eukprot:1368409-Pyramimonas_sp.AAC.2
MGLHPRWDARASWVVGKGRKCAILPRSGVYISSGRANFTSILAQNSIMTSFCIKHLVFNKCVQQMMRRGAPVSPSAEERILILATCCATC